MSMPKNRILQATVPLVSLQAMVAHDVLLARQETNARDVVRIDPAPRDACQGSDLASYLQVGDGVSPAALMLHVAANSQQRWTHQIVCQLQEVWRQDDEDQTGDVCVEPCAVGSCCLPRN